MNLSEKTLELMKSLTEIISISGNEMTLSRELKKKYLQYTDEVIYDNLGSIFAIKRSKIKAARKIMLCSHMDETGFLVRRIRENGLLEILPLSSVSSEGLHCSRGSLINRTGAVFNGVFIQDASNPERLLFDIGATHEEQLIDLAVHIGDDVVASGSFEQLLEGQRLLSKAWHSRLGCVLGIEILEALKAVDLEMDLYIGGTVQHVVGSRGAQTATNLIQPDAAIVLDGLQADDGKEDFGKLGKGIMITYYDKSMIPNRSFLRFLKKICIENNIKHQSAFSSKESDGGWIHKLLLGCPTLYACIGVKNLNSSSEMIDAEDYLALKNGVLKVLSTLTPEMIESFKMENR